MKARLMTVGAVAALLVAVIAMSSSAGAGAESAQRGSPTFQGSAKLRKALTVRGILGHLRQLQSFADANGGTRAAGFPGFTASADYVAQTMQDAGWQVTRQPFDFDFFFEDAPTTFEQVSPDPATYTEDVDYATTEFSGSGNVTAALVAVDLTFPPTPEPSSSSGCEPSDFDGLAITGRVALIQRGTCDLPGQGRQRRRRRRRRGRPLQRGPGGAHAT